MCQPQTHKQRGGRKGVKVGRKWGLKRFPNWGYGTAAVELQWVLGCSTLRNK